LTTNGTHTKKRLLLDEIRPAGGLHFSSSRGDLGKAAWRSLHGGLFEKEANKYGWTVNPTKRRSSKNNAEVADRSYKKRAKEGETIVFLLLLNDSCVCTAHTSLPIIYYLSNVLSFAEAGA
jgi:hypothetical protein